MINSEILLNNSWKNIHDEDVNTFLEDNGIYEEDIINIETINCGLKIWYKSKDE
jgi:hypothetical protein